MSIQTQQIDQSDHWHAFMAKVLSAWDLQLEAEGFKPETIELLECDHCATDWTNHLYLVKCIATGELMMLYWHKNGDEYRPMIAKQGEFYWADDNGDWAAI